MKKMFFVQLVGGYKYLEQEMIITNNHKNFEEAAYVAVDLVN